MPRVEVAIRRATRRSGWWLAGMVQESTGALRYGLGYTETAAITNAWSVLNGNPHCCMLAEVHDLVSHVVQSNCALTGTKNISPRDFLHLVGIVLMPGSCLRVDDLRERHIALETNEDWNASVERVRRTNRFQELAQGLQRGALHWNQFIPRGTISGRISGRNSGRSSYPTTMRAPRAR